MSFIPSGPNSRCSRNSSNGSPETTSTIRAAVLMPDWQYTHFEPGSNATGLAT